MKKKPASPKPDTTVPDEILELAQEMAVEPAPRAGKCVVCEGETAPNSSEGLCWVCRRLKISAWRDSDQQMPAQE